MWQRRAGAVHCPSACADSPPACVRRLSAARARGTAAQAHAKSAAKPIPRRGACGRCGPEMRPRRTWCLRRSPRLTLSASLRWSRMRARAPARRRRDRRRMSSPRSLRLEVLARTVRYCRRRVGTSRPTRWGPSRCERSARRFRRRSVSARSSIAEWLSCGSRCCRRRRLCRADHRAVPRRTSSSCHRR